MPYDNRKFGSELRMSNTKIMLLIELCKQHECLWNTRLEDYPNKYKRNRAAVDIANKLNIEGFTSHHVFVKFKNLRSAYCQEMKKIDAKKALVAAGKAKSMYKPTVCWYPALDSFIKPHVRRKTARPNENSNDKEMTSEQEDNGGKMECEVQEHINLTINKTTKAVTMDLCENKKTDDYEPVTTKEACCKIEYTDNEIEEYVDQDDLSIKEEQNELDSQAQTCSDYLVENESDFHGCFGKYVASLLSKMPPQKALELQPKILSLIFSHFEGN